MINILLARTFLIVGGMLLITVLTARTNKTFETPKEMRITIIGSFVCLFAVLCFADVYPINLILVAIFSALMGREIGPTIEFYNKRSQVKQFLKSRGITLKRGERVSDELKKEFEGSLHTQTHTNQWQNVVFQALSATTFAVLATAGIVYFTNLDFSFLESFLFIALLILIVMGILNIFLFRSSWLRLARGYLGTIIFTLYLLYDFDKLKTLANDQTWMTAIHIAVNIYLDIINLFLSLLSILGNSSK